MSHKLYGNSILIVPAARYMVFVGLALLVFMLVSGFSHAQKEENRKHDTLICPKCGNVQVIER